MSNNNAEQSAVYTLLDKLPSWSYGSVVTLLVFGLVLKALGIDFANPINKFSDAYVESIRMQNENVDKFNEAVGKFEAIIIQQSNTISQLAIEVGKNSRRIEQVEMKYDDFGNRIYSLEDFRNRHDK